jgi:hypothetical protein
MPPSLWSFWKREPRGRRANPRPLRRLTLEWLETRSLPSAAVLTAPAADASSPAGVAAAGDAVSPLAVVTTETLTASTSSVSAGSTTTFTLFLPTGDSTPGDTYHFIMDGSTDLGTATVDANGVATFTVILPAGTHTITAVCPAGTVSPPVTVTATLPAGPVPTAPAQPVIPAPAASAQVTAPFVPSILDLGPALSDPPAGFADPPAPVLAPADPSVLASDPPPDVGGSTAAGLLSTPAAGTLADTPTALAVEDAEAPIGIPSEPSAPAVLESAPGPERLAAPTAPALGDVLVVLEGVPGPGTLAAGVGEDGASAYGTGDEQLPPDDVQLPAPAVADTPTETTVAPTEAPLTVTVELGADFVPAGKTGQVGTDSSPAASPSAGDPEGGSPHGATLAPMNETPTPLGNGPASPGDPPRAQPGNPADAAVDPEIQERLRRLELDRPTEERGSDDLQSSRPVPAPQDVSDFLAASGQDQGPGQPPSGPDPAAMPGAPSDPWSLIWLDNSAAGGSRGNGHSLASVTTERLRCADPAAGLASTSWEWSPALLAALAARTLTAGADGPGRTDRTALDPEGRRTRPRRAGR